MKPYNTTTMLLDLGEINSTFKFEDYKTHWQLFPIKLADDFKRQLELLTQREIDLLGYFNTYIVSETITKLSTQYIGEENAKIFADLCGLFSMPTSSIGSTLTALDTNECISFGEILLLLLLALLLVTPYNIVASIYGQPRIDAIASQLSADSDNMEYVAAIGVLKDISQEDKMNIIGSIWNCIIDAIDVKTSNKELKGGE